MENKNFILVVRECFPSEVVSSFRNYFMSFDKSQKKCKKPKNFKRIRNDFIYNPLFRNDCISNTGISNWDVFDLKNSKKKKTQVKEFVINQKGPKDR